MDSYKLWISQVSESDSTTKHYLYDIREFEAWALETFELNVKELPHLWRDAKYSGEVAKEKFLDELKDVVKAYFGYLKGKYVPLAVNRHISTVMSFLHCFEIPIKPKRLKYPYVVYHNRDIKKEELRLILDHSSVRNQAAYLMLYESGMRPDTQAKLRFKHIKEDFVTGRVPMKIELTADILKCRISERWTFIGEEGFEALKKYLVIRVPLKDDDYVFVREKPQGGKLEGNAMSQAFNKIVQKLGLAKSLGKGKPKPLRLYCLKKAFRKFMVVEEAYKEFWMGRSNTSTHYVSRDLEYHRRLYAEEYENLRLRKPSESKMAGITLEDVEKVKQLLELMKEGRITVTP